MSDNTKIEWTDATWNPITGCSVVSAGCRECYAMKLAGTRLKHHPSRAGLTVDTKNGPVWTGEVRLNEQWLSQPMRWKRPRMIFVCAHSDLFHEAVPDDWIDLVFSAMELSPQHTFQVLTKRAARMRDYINGRAWKDYPLPNVWLGVSVENQDAADERIPLLLNTPAAVRWISAEPLLGALNIRPGIGLTFDNVPVEPPRIDWVVVGGESGQHSRPMHPDWARSLRDQCAASGVPFLFKQWGEWVPHGPIPGGDEARDLRSGIVQYMIGDGREFDGHFRRGDAAVRRVGKKAAGRLLDGVQHDGYPGGVA